MTNLKSDLSRAFSEDGAQQDACGRPGAARRRDDARQVQLGRRPCASRMAACTRNRTTLPAATRRTAGCIGRCVRGCRAHGGIAGAGLQGAWRSPRFMRSAMMRITRRDRRRRSGRNRLVPAKASRRLRIRLPANLRKRRVRRRSESMPPRRIRRLVASMLACPCTRALAILMEKRPRPGLTTQRSPGRTILAAPTP